VRAGHARWFEKTKPGELKNKRAYQMLIWKIYSRYGRGKLNYLDKVYMEN
jgi:hypothetical protein